MRQGKDTEESWRGLDDSRRVLANRSRALCDIVGSSLNRSTGSLTKSNSARLAGPNPRSLPQLMRRALDLRKAREEAYRSVHTSMNEGNGGPPDIDLFVEQDSEALLSHLGASSPLSQSSMASDGNDGSAALVEQSGFLDHSSIDIQIQPQTNTRPLPCMNTRTQTWGELVERSRFVDHSSFDIQRPNSVVQASRTWDSSDTNQQVSSRAALTELVQLARSSASSDTDLLLASLALTTEVSDEEGASAYEDYDMHPPPLLARPRSGARAGEAGGGSGGAGGGAGAGAGAGGAGGAGGFIASESTKGLLLGGSTLTTLLTAEAVSRVVAEGGSSGGTVAGCEGAVEEAEGGWRGKGKERGKGRGGEGGGGGEGWSVSATVLSLCSRAGLAVASQAAGLALKVA
jgi:hypothetical protein